MRNLVKAIKKYKNNIHLIHISTDQVYSGKEIILKAFFVKSIIMEKAN